MARKLDRLALRQLQYLLEALANGHKDLARLVRSAPLATGNVTVTTPGNRLSYGASPDTDTEECLAHVDYHAHDLAVLLLLERLADSTKHRVQPHLVDVDVPLVLEGVGPLATVLVLSVLPFWADAGFEKVVIGLQGKVGDGGNIVLKAG